MAHYRNTPHPRHDLPARRLVETHKIVTPEGRAFHLSIGFDPHEDGRPREVFYSAGFRSGSQLESQIQDACVLVSLLLQHGHRPKDVAKSLARTEQPDGSMVYGSIIGLIVDELVSTSAEADL